tara:strand:- start:663 stop:866 length:204 start_codon:yes stop_codon:yes gene_type:complete
MEITKVTKVTTSIPTTFETDSNKSLVILYDNGVFFSFPETDEDKIKHKSEWDAIQTWVTKGNSIEEL